jgi:hypothetical protein
VLKTVTEFASGLFLDRTFKVLQRGVGFCRIATSKSILVHFFLWLHTQLPNLLGQLLRVKRGGRGALLLQVLAICSGMVSRWESRLWRGSRLRGSSRGRSGLRSTSNLLAPLSAE